MTRRKLISIAPAIATALLVVGSWSSHTTIRFETSWLNYAAFLVLIAAIPFSIGWAAMFETRTNRWPLLIVAASIAAFFAFIGMFAFSDMRHVKDTGLDPSFELITELRSSNSTYRLYRTNGGATTAFGLVLQKETPLVLGLKLVSPVRSFYPAYQAELQALSGTRARIVVAPYAQGQQPESYEFNL